MRYNSDTEPEKPMSHLGHLPQRHGLESAGQQRQQILNPRSADVYNRKAKAIITPLVPCQKPLDSEDVSTSVSGGSKG